MDKKERSATTQMSPAPSAGARSAFQTDGRHTPPHVVAKHHDVSVALLNAMILPGLGQYYNGQSAKAVALMLVEGIALALILFSIWLHNTILLVSALGVFVLVWLLASVDAAVIANRVIHQEPIHPWRWF